MLMTWWPGDTRSQDICSHSIDLFLPEYSDLDGSQENFLENKTLNFVRSYIYIAPWVFAYDK